MTKMQLTQIMEEAGTQNIQIRMEKNVHLLLESKLPYKDLHSHLQIYLLFY